MNCERVEDLLSAYLDNALAFEEWREVNVHLQNCPKCSAMLAEFSRNDALIARLPRISPDPALSIRSFFGLNSWRRQTQATNNGAIAPPTGPLQSGPLSAGIRFVFLRDGTLWSKVTNSTKQADRLTPGNVTVATNWVVSPAQAGRL